MTYREIIDRNLRMYHPVWPRYAFHMAGLENALNILLHGCIYSRSRAKEIGAMVNDNASEDVIGHTDSQVKDYARFYFRPMNPTYFHMEGYHQEGLRYNQEQGVNMTVPVLFLFDLETLLLEKETVFNGIKASAYNFHPLCGVEAFNSLDFEKIYNERSKDRNVILNYRCAEVLYPQRYPIKNALRKIVCRSLSEKITLITELKALGLNLYDQWKDSILYDPSFFDLSALRLDYVVQSKSAVVDDVLQLEFKLNGQSAYYEYIKRYALRDSRVSDYPPLKVIFDVQFAGSKCHHELTANVVLTKPNTSQGLNVIPRDASKFFLKVYFDNRNNLAFSGSISLSKECRLYKLVLDAMDAMPTFPGNNQAIWGADSSLDLDDQLPF